MTNIDTDDLKVFLETILIQRTSHLATKDDVANLRSDFVKLQSEVSTKDDIAKLEQELKEIKTAIEDTVLPYIEEVDVQVQKHDKILRKFKHA